MQHGVCPGGFLNIEQVLGQPSNSMAIRKWPLSTKRKCCMTAAVMFTACTGGALVAFTKNYWIQHRDFRMLMPGGEVGGSGETESWSDFSSSVFRVVGEGGEEARWPELKLDTRSVAAIMLGGIGSSLTTAAGLGGGGLFVPLFNILLQFDPKTSAALSNFVMVGGQFITMLLNLAQSHPLYPDRSLIDFDAALLLQPNLLLGISMGVILNVVFPNWLITLLLTLVLSFMALYSCKSGLKRWRKESNRFALPDHTVSKTSTTDGSSSSSDSCENLIESLLERDSRPRFPVHKIAALGIIWLAFGAVQFIRESKGGKIKCGVGYWLLTASQIPLALIVTHYSVENLRNSAATGSGSSVNHKISSWDDTFVLGPEASSLFPKMALITGVLGGMLGIAGAVIINPMLMSAGMHPQVTAATSGFMVFFSASMSVVQYWLMGRVPLNWAFISAALSALCSAVGILVVQRIINKQGRASVVVFLVAFVLGIGAVLLAILGGRDVWEQLHAGTDMGFHYPCYATLG